ncbi:hypothetical protein HN873_020217, partial [Arachis hypogaea]
FPSAMFMPVSFGLQFTLGYRFQGSESQRNTLDLNVLCPGMEAGTSFVTAFDLL